MSDLNKTTYLPEEMAEEIKGLKEYIGAGADKYVRFYDYDGTLLYHFLPEVFLKLESLPEPPEHVGLISSGWNWNIADAREYISKNLTLDIGAIYMPEDGITKFYVNPREGDLNLAFRFGVNGVVSINWGDDPNAGTEAVDGDNIKDIITVRHTYSAPGDYIISLSVQGVMQLARQTWGEVPSLYPALQHVQIGNNVLIGDYAFENSYQLKTVTLPPGLNAINYLTFSQCVNLVAIVLPATVTVTNIDEYSFSSCASLSVFSAPEYILKRKTDSFSSDLALKKYVMPDFDEHLVPMAFSIPKEMDFVPDGFYMNMKNLKVCVLHQNIVDINYRAFFRCSNLRSVAITSELRRIYSEAFYECQSLTQIKIPDTVTYLGDSAFFGCKSLASCSLSGNITDIHDYTFSGCYMLKEITIPDSVINIGNGAFYGCFSLESIIIPASVKRIGYSAFGLCYSLNSITFCGSVPPLVNESRPFRTPVANTWWWVPERCIIYVPSGTLSLYTSAPNYPDPNKYTYIEYDVDSSNDLTATVLDGVLRIDGTGAKNVGYNLRLNSSKVVTGEHSIEFLS